jgi:phosphoglycolate phosphatase
MSVGFIFDLDGTLVDSSLQIYNQLNFTANQLGMSSFEIDSFNRYFGLPLDKMLIGIGVLQPEIKEFIDIFRKNLRYAILQDNPVFDGVDRLLSQLQTAGFPLGIATSKPSELAQMVYENSKLSNFKMVLVGTDDIPPKPDPTVIRIAMNLLDISKGYMVGDRIEDCIAGQAAGLMTIGITQSAHTLYDFKKVGTDHVFANIQELGRNLKLLLEVG